MINLYILIILLFIKCIGFAHSDLVNYLPYHQKLLSQQYSGYLNIDTVGSKEQMYYNLTFSPKHDILILWLNGGPGASSFYGYFTENGPYKIITNNKKMEVLDYEFAWSKKFNYLIIDQPIGVGYSYPSNNYQIVNQAQTTNELYLALIAFYHKFPHLKTQRLFIAGQSYAGKYILELALKVLINKDSNHIKLTGIMLGDAWVDPKTQQGTDSDYAYYRGLINLLQKKEVDVLYQKCADAIDLNQNNQIANDRCNMIGKYLKKNSGLDLHNIHNLNLKQQTDSEYALIEKYLNLAQVKKSLHINSNKQFTLSSDFVADALAHEIQNSDLSIMQQLLLNYKLNILIYNGLDDATDCNFLGTNLYLSKLNYGKFNAQQQTKKFNYKHQLMGYQTNYQYLTFIKLLNAGHMAPEDVPLNIFNMLEEYVLYAK